MKKIYLNKKQQEFLQARQQLKLFLAGRGTGKTRTLGHSRYLSAAHFPRATGALAGQTYGALLTTTLPEITDVWEADYGLKEGIHYVVGIKPPKHWKTKAFKEPRKYQNIISFANGHRVVLLSSDRPDLHRGGTIIDLDVDEGLKVKSDAFYNVFLPMVRGYRHNFSKSVPGFHQKRIYSTVPRSERGYWLMDLEEKQKQFPGAFKVVSACTMDNVAVLGLDYIENLKMTMHPLDYQAEVLNHFIRKVPDGYYHRFNPEKHCVVNTYSYGSGARGITVDSDDTDRNPNALLEFSVDLGGRINCGIASQYYKNTLNVLREFYVLDEEGKLRELVNRFCDQYADHAMKYVRLWGEPKGKTKAIDSRPYFQEIQRYFVERGWACEICADIKYEDHLSRHNLISEMFLEQTPELPKIRINENHCPNLVLVLQTTKIKDDFTKDKTNEKNYEFPQEKAPHLSDAFDYQIVQLFAEWLNVDGTFHLAHTVEFL